MKEVWKPVPYEPFNTAYEISSLGRVRPTRISRYSKNRAPVLTGLPSPGGYLQVSLYAQGQRRTAIIHRMVAEVFHGPPPFPGAIVCHRNDVKTDNRAVNLEWGTGKSNAATREAIGKTSRGAGNGRALLTDADVRMIRTLYAQGGISQTALAQQFGVAQTAISRIIQRKAWKHLDP